MTENGTVEAGTVSTSAMSKMNRFKEHLELRATVDDNASTDQDKLETQAQIAVRILEANSADDVFAAMDGGSLAGKDLIDVPQTLRGIRVMKGDPSKGFDSGLFGETYVLVDATDLRDGSDFVWNTAAANLVSALIKWEQLDAFPISVVIKQAGSSRAVRFAKYTTPVGA